MNTCHSAFSGSLFSWEPCPHPSVHGVFLWAVLGNLILINFLITVDWPQVKHRIRLSQSGYFLRNLQTANSKKKKLVSGVGYLNNKILNFGLSEVKILSMWTRRALEASLGVRLTGAGVGAGQGNEADRK